jgi:hypothetical protein
VGIRYEFFYFFIIGVTLLLSVLGLCFIAIIPGIDRWNRRFFRAFFIVLILLYCLAVIDIVMYYCFAPDSIMRFIQVLEGQLFAVPLPMLTVLLLHCSGENLRGNKLLQTVLGLQIAFFLLGTSSLFTDAFFIVGADRLSHYGFWYPLLLLPVCAIVLLNLAGTIRRRAVLTRKIFLSFLSAQLPMIITVLIQMFVEDFLLLGVCYVLFALSIYSLILSEQIEQDMQQQREIVRQQQEIANQRLNVMVLQMRPHFIYNTLTSIYCLCSQDPAKAQQVVMDFTTYLRRNFTAVASDMPIPFTSELEHTRAYLAVEQAQHAKSLFVEYDTPHTCFRLPPLTLQPIVENAVKHGLNPDSDPLHVMIRTYHTDTDSVIIVEDNGAGFEMAEDFKPHAALENIRQRLELMCGGKLSITPRDGGGTVVTVTIPNHDVNQIAEPE